MTRALAAFKCFLSWSSAVWDRNLDRTIWTLKCEKFYQYINIIQTHAHDPEEEEAVNHQQAKDNEVVTVEVNVIFSIYWAINENSLNINPIRAVITGQAGDLSRTEPNNQIRII